MPASDSLGLSGFPQIGTGQRLTDLLRDIAATRGLQDDAGGTDLARRCLRRAVHSFNRFAWDFNRMKQEIALVSPAATVNGFAVEYNLNGDFRNATRAHVIKASGEGAGRVRFLPWPKWQIIVEEPFSKGNSPGVYTIRNAHEEGRLIVDPPLDTTNLTYPTLRLWYHRRILLPGNDDGQLNVPVEIEEALVELAASHLTRTVKNAEDARTDFLLAQDIFLDVAQEHRDFMDFDDGSFA